MAENDFKKTSREQRTATVEKIRKIFCEEEGKKNEEKSGEIAKYFVQLAEHETGGNKLSYIRSVSLLNAALRRVMTETEKTRVQDHIKSVVYNFLLESNAQNKDFDIIDASSKIKDKLQIRRENIKEDLKSVQKIQSKDTSKDLKKLETDHIKNVESLQTKVSHLYSQTMEEISKICVDTLGTAPCKFSHFAMGSLAREEITMYSDFENAIVLDDSAFAENNASQRERDLEYFRWYAVLFNILIVNLGETPTHRIGIDGLNDHYAKNPAENWFYDRHVPNGIMFASVVPCVSKTPIGRNSTAEKPQGTELILPLTEMLDFLSDDGAVTERYNLAHMLVESRHVAGDENLFKLYKESSFAKMIRLMKCKEYMEATFNNVRYDLKRFDLTLNFQKLGWQQSVKHTFYRPMSLYVQYLMRMCGMFGCTSNFHGVEELAKTFGLSNKVKHNLLYGVALANQLQMVVYSARGEQKDVMAGAVDAIEKTKDILTVFDAIGEIGALDYYEILLGLASAIARIAECAERDLSKGDADALSIKRSLEDDVKCRGNLKLYGDIYKQFQSYDKATLWYLKALENCDNDVDKVEILMLLGRTNLIGLKFSDSIQYYKQAINLEQRIGRGETSDLIIVEANTMLGQCYTATVSLWEEFTPCLEKAGRICDKLISADQENKEYIKALAEIRDTEGFYFTRTGHYEQSLQKYKTAKNLFEKVYGKVENNDTIKVLNGIAVCLFNLKRYEEAIVKLDRLITSKKQMIGQSVADVTLSRYWRNKGEALMNLNRFEEAIECYLTSLKMRVAAPGPHVEKCATMVVTTYMLLDCFYRCNRFTDALVRAEEVLKLASEIPDTGTGKKYSKLAANLKERMHVMFDKSSE